MDTRSKALQEMYRQLGRDRDAGAFLLGFLSADLQLPHIEAALEALRKHQEERNVLAEVLDLAVAATSSPQE